MKTAFFKNILIGSAVVSGFFLSGCTDDFDKINTPKYTNEYKVADGGDPNLLFPTFIYGGAYDDYQRTTNLYHDIYAHYMAHNKPAFSGSSPNYVYNDGWMSRRWEHYYLDRVKEFRKLNLIFESDPQKYETAKHISFINMAFLAHMMVDTYGDIPYSTIFKGGSDAMDVLEYDNQVDIYYDLFEKLKFAAENIKPVSGEMYDVADKDNYYNGDAEKWRKFANSLRLRLAIRIANYNPAKAKLEGEAAIAAGIMSSNDDICAVTPLYAFTGQGNENIQMLVGYEWADACMTKDLEEAYKNWSKDLDPRCSILWYKNSPRKSLNNYEELDDPKAGFGNYIGRYVGSTDVDQSSENCSLIKSKRDIRDPEFWFDKSREVVWMSYSECQFLLAEAALRGWAGASNSVQKYYEDGIRANMEYYELSSAQIATYINQLTIYKDGANPFNGGDKEQALEQIINQKWLAVFPNGNEGWAIFRRTDYPRLHDNKNNMGVLVEAGKFIKRVRYPVSEQDYNQENIPEALRGYGDRMDITKTERLIKSVGNLIA